MNSQIKSDECFFAPINGRKKLLCEHFSITVQKLIFRAAISSPFYTRQISGISMFETVKTTMAEKWSI